MVYSSAVHQSHTRWFPLLWSRGDRRMQ